MESKSRFKPKWLLLFITTIIIVNIAPTTSYSPSESYSTHCNHIVPSSNPTNFNDVTFRSFRLTRASFSGANSLFPNHSPGKDPTFLRFNTRRVTKTDTEGIFHLKSVLSLQYFNASSQDLERMLYSQEFHVRNPWFHAQRSGVGFELDGFWDSGSGKLCMVGSGSGHSRSKEGNFLNYQAVLKLNYPNATNVYTSLVHGVLESLDLEHSLAYFDTASIFGVSVRNYELTLIDKESENEWFGGYGGLNNLSLGFGPNTDVCARYVRRMDQFELDYGDDYCDHHANCNPLGQSVSIYPQTMSFDKVLCLKDQRMWLLLRFGKSGHAAFLKPFDPRAMFVAEGIWDVDNNMLRIIACRISGSVVNASVVDCSIRLTLRFSSTLSLRNMAVVEGQLWSNRDENDKDYFARLGVSSSKGSMMDILGLNYEYTEINNVKSVCAKPKIYKHKGSKYSDAKSSDLRFGMSVKNSKGQNANGYITPLFVNNNQYSTYNLVSENKSSPLNISYQISLTLPPGFKLGHEILVRKSVQIFAEGVYDAQTGLLCMKGCRHLESYNQKPSKNNSLDCEVLVNVQYPSINSKGGVSVKGSIESTRTKNDPLYFDRLQLSSNSINTRQAAESISRMDLEIAMVLISNTAACVFVGLQLFYVKKNPNVLPFISIVMLVILTLSHMIPLILNVEALFSKQHSMYNGFLDNGEWLEIKEVIVRLVKLIAVLLQAYLLQQTWSARLDDEKNQKSLWVSDKKVIYLSIPLYILGGLIAWFVHKWKNSFLHGRHLLLLEHFPIHRQNYFWVDVKSYGGLIMDGFLIPQILFNLFFNSKEKALAPVFYIGTTVVRVLPHAYDLYRAHSTSWSLDFSYIYANPRMDLYSTAWDVIIPCTGLIFVVLVYLQQRFGGRFFLPKRFRESSEYEKVPVLEVEL